MTDLQQDIQQQLHELDSQIDLVAVERPGSEALRLFIDHPDGVNLELCERVTKHLNHLLLDFSLEVSSPGPKHRPASAAETVEEPASRSEEAFMSDSSRASEAEPKGIQ